MRALDLVALKHIGQLPSLVPLVLGTVTDESSFSPTVSDPLFRNLQSLILRAVDIGAALTFFGMCSQLPLKSLALRFNTDLSVWEREHFYTTLASSCSHSSLTSIILGTHGAIMEPMLDAQGSTDLMVNDQAFRILFCFVNITLLYLISTCFSLSNATIVDAGRAWPYIETLHLITLSRRTAVCMTLESLSFLAESFPRLRTLTIAFDATALPTPRPPVVQRHLIAMDVQLSPMSTSGPVARFLSGIFPNLRTVTTDVDNYPEDPRNGETAAVIHSLWKTVEALIPEFAAARKEGFLRVHDPIA
ncbi:hypothetical protein DFH09DRAFT_1309990 [Mycena vulgaris]|nr:hypothetical protein DFH09DRAFT_1309990 [Mycena vulgaris]